MLKGQRITSRRKPRLRVVGPTLDETRHAAVVYVLGVEYIAEIFRFEDREKLTGTTWPARGFLVPGVGFLTLSTPLSQDEARDVRDVCDQALELFHEYGRG